jgi:hypothetical protein
LLNTRDQGLEGSNVDVVLDLGQKANVTDAWDKVYGVLGLLPSQLSAMISPDIPFLVPWGRYTINLLGKRSMSSKGLVPCTMPNAEKSK